jgi:hypothetical protein
MGLLIDGPRFCYLHGKNGNAGIAVAGEKEKE